jgi:predicted dehydrogenase
MPKFFEKERNYDIDIYNVLIIGAGNIGAFFDIPESERILTHAHAFTKHAGFKLIGFFDNDIKKAQKAADIWGCNAFKSIDEAFKFEKVDIVIVAVPDEYHYAVLKEISKFSVKVVFAEKPLTKTVVEANEIVQIFKDKNIDVIVNYSRRFVPEFERIKNNIETGIYGEYMTGTGYYGKGIIHNGSHLIDLLRYLIGEIDTIKPISSIQDFYPDDKSISAVFTFENNRPFFLQYADCRKYTIFEIDILFERKRIRIYDSGFKIEEYDIQDNKIFKGYKNVVKTADIDTSLHNALYNAAENIYKHLIEGQNLKCNIEDGYKTLITSIKIKESV